MAWLFVLALALTLAALGFAGTVTVLVARDHRRRGRAHTREASASPGHGEPDAVPLSEAADCVQLWLDDQWHQKYGRDLTDRSDTVDG